MATPNAQRLGRYQVIDQIGKGSMGVVYLAKDPLIGRLVALKTFHLGPGPSDSERAQYRQRFMREAQSGGSLSHPNIVTVHDVVETDDGTLVIAMEYVRGTNLKELLDSDEAFDLPYISDIISQLASALQFAHSRGVVHRDIKPANILLTTKGEVKIADFGIAQIDTSSLTHAGQLLGTPNYMAPEQVQGREVDHRADLFATGVVLYEMVTRRKPFAGENLTVVSHRIVNDRFTPPEQFVGKLPEGLAEIFEKALDKNPDRRYQRAEQLAADLRAVAEKVTSAAMLNETQEITLPDLPLPSGGDAAGPAEGGKAGSGAVGAVTDRARAVARRAVGAAARLSSALATWWRARREAVPAVGRKRLAVVAIATLVVATLTGALGLWSLTADEPSQEQLAAEERHREVLPLTYRAGLLVRQGEPAAAAALYGIAERIDPDNERIRRLREKAEEMAADAARQHSRSTEVLAALEAGELAFTEGRYADALDEAGKVLEVEPLNVSATSLAARVKAAMEQRERRRLAAAERRRRPPPITEVAEAATTPAEDRPTDTVSEPSAPPVTVPSGPAKLSVRFASQLSAGVLTIYRGEAQLLRESFRFVEKTGFLRSRPVPGAFDRLIEVEPGEADLRIYVALERSRDLAAGTRSEAVQGNFPPGSERALVVRVGRTGKLDVLLE